MSNEVKVIFMGMCLWWLPQTGEKYVLMPDLSTAKPQHSARIFAPSAAFVGGCPQRFQRPDPQSCVFDLNANAAPGGVQLALLTNTPAEGFSPGGFCDIPKLRSETPDTLFKLLPKFTPPKGAGNVAWMDVVGGQPSTAIHPCELGDAQCARSVEWSVPVSEQSHVVLALSNVKTAGAPMTILAQLADGAILTVSNQPPFMTAAAHDMEPVVPKDWCNYFQMIVKSDGETAACLPPEPPLCLTKARAPRRIPFTVDITTIACSNSQYP